MPESGHQTDGECGRYPNRGPGSEPVCVPDGSGRGPETKPGREPGCEPDREPDRELAASGGGAQAGQVEPVQRDRHPHGPSEYEGDDHHANSDCKKPIEFLNVEEVPACECEEESSEQGLEGGGDVAGCAAARGGPEFVEFDVATGAAFARLAGTEVIGEGGEPASDVVWVIAGAVGLGVLANGGGDKPGEQVMVNAHIVWQIDQFTWVFAGRIVGGNGQEQPQRRRECGGEGTLGVIGNVA